MLYQAIRAIRGRREHATMPTIDDIWPLAIAAGCTLCLMPLAILARPTIGIRVAGVQDLHVEPTSRLGGAIVFLAYIVGIYTSLIFRLAPARPMVALIVCALPVIGAGVWEDLTRALPPRHRLLAAATAALLACLIANGITARLDIPYVDQLLQWAPAFAIVLTCFMAVGACNAINLIDGANGLAGGTALLMFAGIGVVALHMGDQLILVQAAAIAGALVGFLIWNYPKARIFLGDGGAYFIGFIYAELSIQIVARNEHLSAWFVIMLAAYPIVETVFSMYRRLVVLRKPSMQPDLLHLHSLIYRVVTLPAEHARPDTNLDRANARVAPMLWLHGLYCFVVALSFHDNTPGLLAGIAGYCAIYGVHYRVLWKMRSAEEGAVVLPPKGNGYPAVENE